MGLPGTPSRPYNRRVDTSSRFRDLTVAQFVEALASGEPVPGGGAPPRSPAAWAPRWSRWSPTSPRGARSTRSTPRCTPGRSPRRRSWWTASSPSPTRMPRHSPGYGAAMKLPRETDEERAARTAAIREAALAATLSPLRTVEACAGGRRARRGARRPQQQERVVGPRGRGADVRRGLPLRRRERVHQPAEPRRRAPGPRALRADRGHRGRRRAAGLPDPRAGPWRRVARTRCPPTRHDRLRRRRRAAPPARRPDRHRRSASRSPPTSPRSSDGVRLHAGARRRGRRQGRAVGGLPAQDPRRLPPGRASRTAWSSCPRTPTRPTSGPRCASSRPTPTWPGSSPRCRSRRASALQGRDRRPGPAARHRRDPPAQRRAPVARATTASCRRPPTPASRSSSRAASRSPASTPSSSAAPTSSASRRRSCSCARTPRSRSATARPQDLADVIRSADIVVVAIGRANFVTGDMLKPGAVVVDVGINVVDGKLTGDVEFASASRVASAITPGPGRRRAAHQRDPAHPPRAGRPRPGQGPGPAGRPLPRRRHAGGHA